MAAADTLKSVTFFSGVVGPDALEQLAAATGAVQFARGAVMMRQGDLGQSMFVIVTGNAVVSVREPGGEQRVATLGPGDIVGEMSLLTGARRSATVTAKGKVTALEIAKPALEPILAAAPELVGRFAAMVEQRQAELRQRHSDSGRWNAVGFGRAEIAARMTAFYSG